MMCLTSNIHDKYIKRIQVLTTIQKIVAEKNGFDQMNSRSRAIRYYKNRIFLISLEIIVMELLKHGHNQVSTSDFRIQDIVIYQ